MSKVLFVIGMLTLAMAGYFVGYQHGYSDADMHGHGAAAGYVQGYKDGKALCDNRD